MKGTLLAIKYVNLKYFDIKTKWMCEKILNHFREQRDSWKKKKLIMHKIMTGCGTGSLKALWRIRNPLKN